MIQIIENPCVVTNIILKLLKRYILKTIFRYLARSYSYTLTLLLVACLSLNDPLLVARYCLEREFEEIKPFEAVEDASKSLPSLFFVNLVAATRLGLKDFSFLLFP